MVNFAYLPTQRISNDLDGMFQSPHDAPPKWLFVLSQLEMYTAYLDETGQQTNGWVFVTGFLGNEEQWSQFVPHWKDGLGKRTKFHMHELRWKHPRTKALLKRLGPIPESCGLKAVVGGVKYSDYQDLIAGSIVEKLSEGYIWCLFPLVLTMLKYIPSNERVELFFGPQDRYRDRALDLLDFFAKETLGDPRFCTTHGLPKLAKWSFAPPGENSIMFHPADYYASALAHVYHDKTSEKAQLCMPILDSNKWVGKILNREEIRGQVTRARQELLDAGIRF